MTVIPSTSPRPSRHEILDRWTATVSDPLLSLESLRRQAVEGSLAQKHLRSLSWRFFFSLLPSPATLADAGSTSTSPSSSNHAAYSVLLARQRTDYDDLRERYLRAPDGGWIHDGESTNDAVLAGTSGASKENGNDRSTTGNARPVKVDAKVNNPLGLEQDNPWQSWFSDLELRKTIRQDVQRTFPEIDYFRLASTQNRLTDLLFVYTKLTPDVGYRQGMHELLAPILWTVDFDSITKHDDDDNGSLAHLVLSRDFVEHDTWSLFSTLMKSTAPFYDHNATIPVSRTQSQPAQRNAAFGLSGVNGSSSTTTLVQPIVAIAGRLHSLMSTLDPQLHAAFTRLQIEPQLYAIRWLRLLFSREFPLSETLVLWDGLFARDPSLQITQHVAAAMLLRIRDALIAAEREGGYGEFLQVLLRYPACPDGTFRTSLLLSQAIYLRDNLSLDGADHVRRENERLGLTTHVHESSDEGVDMRSASARGAHGHRKASTMVANANLPGPLSGVGLLGEGGLGDLAKGVYGRAEALGINRAILGTFNDIKRGYTAAQAQLEEQRQRQRSSLSQIPSRPPWENHPPPPPPAFKDALSDLAKMRASSIAMANALDLCVSVLERALTPPTPVMPSSEFEGAQGSGGGEPTRIGSSSSSSTLRGSAASAAALAPQVMAITALKHVRDVLGGQANSFDSSVLHPLQQTLDLLNKSPPLPPLPFDSPGIPMESPTISYSPATPVAPEPSEPARLPPDENATTQPRSTNSPAPTPASQPPPPTRPRSPPLQTLRAKESAASLLAGARDDKPLPALTRTPPLAPSASPRPNDPLSSSFRPVGGHGTSVSSSSSTSSGRPSPLLTTYAAPTPAASSPSDRSPRHESQFPPSPTFDPLGVL
ncbi:hypothetical protein JCM10212_003323 [Sporobolomyces blumeae]